jgi:hypothetical protein
MDTEWYGFKELYRKFRIISQGVYVSGESKPNKGVLEGKPIFRSSQGKRYENAFKSLVYDPKPVDLFLGKVKSLERVVEAWRVAVCIRSCNLWIGVKGQSRPVIAGSYRNRPKSSLRGDRWRGRATDWRARGRNPSPSCPTPNASTL